MRAIALLLWGGVLFLPIAVFPEITVPEMAVKTAAPRENTHSCLKTDGKNSSTYSRNNRWLIELLLCPAIIQKHPHILCGNKCIAIPLYRDYPAGNM